jgi:hypothetical protein
VAAGFVGAVLFLAGLAKLAAADWRRTAGLSPSGPVTSGSATSESAISRALVVLPGLELAIGALLIAGYRWAGAAAVAILVPFTLVLARRVTQHDATPCGCFGEVSTRPVSAVSVARNLLLIGAALVVVGGWDLGRHGAGLVAGRLVGVAAGLVLVAAERGLVRHR